MNCKDLLPALNDYVDGATQSALCRALREHLSGCQGCRLVIDNLRQTITLYKAGAAGAGQPTCTSDSAGRCGGGGRPSSRRSKDRDDTRTGIYRFFLLGSRTMKGFALLLGAMLLWIVLNRWILPWCGIRTCMSGGCTADRCPPCGPGPWSHTDKDVVNPNGDQQ